jgi:hypothetical protein
MWTGVIKGLAGVKLSGSLKRYGLKKINIITKINKNINPIKSLNLK